MVSQNGEVSFEITDWQEGNFCFSPRYPPPKRASKCSRHAVSWSPERNE